jgi:hypothetical protein
MPPRRKGAQSGLEAFLHKERKPPLAKNVTPAEQTAFDLRETRDRYAKKQKAVTEKQPSAKTTQAIITRAAVLDVFKQALEAVATYPQKHAQIAAEATRKVAIILDIITADPDDPVFLLAGQLLSPLEPHYANPRISEVEVRAKPRHQKSRKDSETQEDHYAHRAQYRLESWKAEGWPEKYPRKAVEKEKQEGMGMAAEYYEGNMRLREMGRRAVEKSNEELAGIVEVENAEREVASRVKGVRRGWGEIGRRREEEGGGGEVDDDDEEERGRGRERNGFDEDDDDDENEGHGGNARDKMDVDEGVDDREEEDSDDWS